MKSFKSNESRFLENSNRGSRASWIIGSGCLLITLIAIFLPRPKAPPADRPAAADTAALANSRHAGVGRITSIHQRLRSPAISVPAKTAEEIIAEKVSQFGRNRRELARAIARRLNREVPLEIEAFFDAVESGNWDEIHSRWKELATHTHQYEYSKDDRPDLEPFWATVLDTYGVAEQAHEWPAQKLLDYGNALLDSLRPGMVYVGGTDNGRWVPELLNETGADPHIILTQNALADGTYLDYLRDLYGERFNTLSQEDSQRAFQEYTADAQSRFQHDQDFPDEPKQIRPGENIQMKYGGVQVSGMTAVMAINEKLLQMLMQKNPDLSFAMQESQPLRGMYADAVPLGPLMELGAQNTFDAERATQSLDYWRTTAQNLFADPEASASTYALRSYSHDVNSTANLLAAHNYDTEAEQAYRLSSQLWPGNPDATGGLATILARTGHADQARQLLDDFAHNYPDQRPAIETFRGTILWTAAAQP